MNRLLTDADVVLPIGRLGHDPVLGYSGPWGAVYPLMSDAPTRQALRATASDLLPDAQHDRPALAESAEVSWLLGSQFHVGVLPGMEGASEILAGRDAAVRAEALRRVDASWTCTAPEEADLVVVGIGVPWKPTTLDDLAQGLTAAARLVRSGGKIVALSCAVGVTGRAWKRLAERDDLDASPALLKGLEAEPDYLAARRLILALARADVYLLSRLDAELVESLGLIPLSSPAEAARLAGRSASCSVLDAGELVRIQSGGTMPDG